MTVGGATRTYSHGIIPITEWSECKMVFEKIRDIIVDQLDVEEDAVTLEASIADDLGADSLDVVDLVMSIEESFDIEIPDEEVENIKTVGDIVKFIEAKTEE
jgi:acyl carrier protein